MTAGAISADTAAFAGRSAELAILQDAAAAAKAGSFSAVLISGEAGIGKTRLVEETCNYARALGFATAAGRCFDIQRAFNYFPFLEAFRQLTKQWPARPASAERTSTPRQDREAVDILTRLGARASRSIRPRAQTKPAAQADLFDTITCFLSKRADPCPLLLVLEDLDWADEGSLSLLVHLVRMLTNQRVLLIGTFRGDPLPRRLELGRALADLGRHRRCRRIRLKGLPASEAAGLLEQLLGRGSAGEAKRLTPEIVKLTNGNPQLIHQIVRHLVETARISRRGDQWVAMPDWDSKLATDEALRELVDARLAQLSEPCRRVLGDAAILGNDFEFEVLTKIVPVGASDLTTLLDEANEAGILTEARSDETGDYAFVHGLIRRSLYARQSRPARRALHADAGRAIEAVHCTDRDSYVSQLALHYTKAGRAGDLAKAAEYSMRAGETASALGAYVDAASHWRAALKLASVRNRMLRAQLAERLGEVGLLSSATPAEAAHHLRAALKLYAEIGNPADTARVHARLVTVLSLSSMNPAAINVGQAVAHSQRAEKLLASRDDPIAEGELLIGQAFAAHAQFRTAEGLESSTRAMQIGELLNNATIWCQAAAWRGHFLSASGKLKEGIGLMEQAVERAERMQDLKPRFAAAWLLSFSYLLLQDPAAAEQTIEATLTDADAGQVDFVRQVLVAHLGLANVFAGEFARARSLLSLAPHRFLEANLRFFEGDWTQAEDLLTEQIERSNVAQNKQQHWTASLWLARLKRIEGDEARALDLLTHTSLISESLLRVPEEIATRSELALVRLARGELTEARAEVRRCRALLAPDEDWRALSALVDRAEAALLTHEGVMEKASDLWRSAGQVFSQHRLPWEVAETLAIYGALLIRQGKSEEGEAKLSAASQIYRHLDAGARWETRIQELREPVKAAVVAASADRLIKTTPVPAEIHSLATTQDVALLATLIHDAIAHLMNAIDKAAKLRAPIERIAAATERIGNLSIPVERLVRALEQRDSAPSTSHGSSQRTRPGASTRQKLNRSHDPGRPL